MKKGRAILLVGAAAIAAAAVLSGCTKSTFSSHRGELIQFATVSRGSAATKTSYGDEPADGEKQAINWVNNDVITIASPDATVQNGTGNISHYVITGAFSGVPSTATVKNEGANGLMWGDEGTYRFYGVYPKASSKGISVDLSGKVSANMDESQTNTLGSKKKKSSDQTITYKVYEPDMNLAYMTAATTVDTKDKQWNGKVSLEFFPAFTAFEFNVSSQDDDPIEITQIQLVEDSADAGLSGAYSMSAGTRAAQSASIKTLNTTTGEGESAAGVTVTSTEGASFTLFTAPVKNTKALKLRVTSKDDNGSKTSFVSLTYAKDFETHVAGDAVQFEAGHKYRINMLKLPSSQWKISISVDLEPWGTGEETVMYI